jgi:hypothetical protein
MEGECNSRTNVSKMQLYENKAVCGISQRVGTDMGVRNRRRVSVNEHGWWQYRPHEPLYSSRSNINGSIESARCAGIHVASSPSINITRTAQVNTSGSRGVA